jgi:hypothetical protein
MSESINKYCSDILFSTPSFVKGMGTVINIWGNYFSFNYSQTPEEADRRALACDWRMVGQDIRNAMEKISQEI